MPNLNQKGPMNEGSMTGRKMGRCTNFGARRINQTTQKGENRENPVNETPINDNLANNNAQGQRQGQGLGRGRGRGVGRGMRNGMGNGSGQNRGGRGMAQGAGGGGRGMGRRFPTDNIEQ